MPTARLLRNTTANVLGRLVAAASSVIAAPITIRAVGREGYGIVTFTLALGAFAALLEMGLGATANRLLAQESASGRPAAQQANMLRTFELIHWFCALLIIGTAFTVSAWAARDWLRMSTVGVSEGASVVALTGLMLGLRFPVGLYSGILFGLRRHVAQNIIFGGSSAARYLGGAALVVFVSPSVLSYAKWLAFTSFVEVIVAAAVAWTAIEGRPLFWSSRFDKTILAKHWRFSLAFAATGATVSLAASLDKIFLGNMLPIGDLGLYGLLYTPAGALTLVASALALATFPEFAAATTAQKTEARALFAKAQAVTLYCVALVGIPLATHFGPVLRLWTRDDSVARDGLAPGVILVFALAISALANPAYMFLVATGRPRIPLTWNIFALPLSAIALLAFVPRLGLIGAATAVLIVNSLGLCFYLVQINRLLKLDGYDIRRATKVVLLLLLLCATNIGINVGCSSDVVRLGVGCVLSLGIGAVALSRIRPAPVLTSESIRVT